MIIVKKHNHEHDKQEPDTRNKFELDEHKKYVVETRFELPIYIPIPDGIYEIRAKSMNALAKLHRVNKSTSVSKAVSVSENAFIYVPHLRYDPFNSTEILMRFEPSLDTIRKLKSPEQGETDPYTNGPIDPILQESLLFVNKLVSTYQYYSGNTAIGRIQTWDIGNFNVRLMPLPIESPSTIRIIAGIGYSRPMKSGIGPPTDKETLDEITDKVKREWKVPTQTRLLIAARHLYLMGEYSAAVVTAQSALELFLSRNLGKHLEYITIQRKRKKTQIPLKRATLSTMLDEGLKQAIGKKLNALDSTLAQRNKESRRVRNDVVHEGLEATMNDADKCIKTFSEVIGELSLVL